MFFLFRGIFTSNFLPGFLPVQITAITGRQAPGIGFGRLKRVRALWVSVEITFSLFQTNYGPVQQWQYTVCFNRLAGRLTLNCLQVHKDPFSHGDRGIALDLLCKSISQDTESHPQPMYVSSGEQLLKIYRGIRPILRYREDQTLYSLKNESAGRFAVCQVLTACSRVISQVTCMLPTANAMERAKNPMRQCSVCSTMIPPLRACSQRYFFVKAVTDQRRRFGKQKIVAACEKS